MTIYNYKIVDKEGKTAEGVADAQDKASLYHLIKKEDNTVVSIEEKKEDGVFSYVHMILSKLDGVKTRDKITFARNLGKMIESGLPITRALSVLERQAGKGAFKKILKNLEESLAKGNSLSDSMKKYPEAFSPLFVSMVKAGEESGNMSVALKNVALQMEKTYLLGKKVRGAMMYPTVIFSLMIFIGMLMMIYMVPTLTTTFAGLGIKLPLSTRIIIGISNFLKNYFGLTVLGLGVIIASVAAIIRTPKGGRVVDFISLHTPIIGEITRQLNSARTARTMSSLLSSGVNIVFAMGVTKDVLQNSYYKDVLEKARLTIQKGDQISSIFLSNDKLYPLYVGEMVAVGEETGNIGEMLAGVAQFYEDEVDQKTKDLSSVIEPLLMIIIGAAVGFFAISMLAPTYSLADSI